MSIVTYQPRPKDVWCMPDKRNVFKFEFISPVSLSLSSIEFPNLRFNLLLLLLS